MRDEINKLKDKLEKLEKDIKTQSTDTELLIESEHDTATVEDYEKWCSCSMCGIFFIFIFPSAFKALPVLNVTTRPVLDTPHLNQPGLPHSCGHNPR